MDFLLFAVEDLTEKGVFAGAFAGCPRDTRPSGGYRKLSVVLSCVPLLLPNYATNLLILLRV